MDAGEIYNYSNLCHGFCFFSHFSHLDQSGSGHCFQSLPEQKVPINQTKPC